MHRMMRSSLLIVVLTLRCTGVRWAEAAGAESSRCQTVADWSNGAGKDNLGMLKNNTAGGCCAKCESTKHCLTWTLRNGDCWLHGKSHNPSARPWSSCVGCITGNNGRGGPLPPTPSPTPATHRPIRNSTKVLGAINFLAAESTPLVFAGRLLVMETIGFCYPFHVRLDNPVLDGAACPGYVQVRDLQSGEVVANLTGGAANSCNRSFAAAFVDRDLATGSETLYIYAARSPRFQVSQPWCNHSSSSKSSANFHSHDPCWGKGGNYSQCAVDIYYSSDLDAWHTSQTPLKTNGTRVSNVDVVPVPAAALAHTPGLPVETKYLMVMATTGKLVASSSPIAGWQYVDGLRAQHQGASGAPSGSVNCMSIRYGDDGYWYLLGGGTGISITRSRDLLTWQGGDYDVSNCRDTRDRQPARFSGLFEWSPQPWQHGPSNPEAILSSGTREGRPWDTDASDVDLTEWVRPGLPTVTISIHWCGNQHDTWFTIASVFNGTQTAWLASFFNASS